MTEYSITREIGIDAGHRVPDHGSKCKNLHGHRYKIQATCTSKQLFDEGEQKGMVLDFGFLKEFMLEEIDAPCDHGTILYIEDKLVKRVTGGGEYVLIKDAIGKSGGYARENDRSIFSKLYVVPFIPTAENLSKHWFQRLDNRIKDEYGNRVKLARVRVWETPNCFADFPACKADSNVVY